MKRKILTFFLFTVLLTTSFAFGDSYGKKITAYFYNIKVLFDGKPVALSSEPFVYEGTTYVPLRDVSEIIGLNVYWDENNKSVYIHSDNANYNKDYEIASLKNQLKDKDKEIEKLKDDDDDDDDDDSSSKNDDDLDNIEDDLEDDYDEYTESSYANLEFSYKVTQLSNDNIRVKMTGDFDKTSTAWNKRGTSDFRDFIKDICYVVKKEFNEDIEIIVYDKDDDRVAEYFYDYSDKELDKEYEYED